MSGTEWFYVKDGQHTGPISTEQLLELLAAGLPPETLVWGPGLSAWAPAATIAELAQQLPQLSQETRAPETPLDPGVVTDQSATGIEAKLGFFPLAFLLLLCTPTVVIDGQRQRKPWGRHFFPTAPGSHHMRIFFGYLFRPECGANEITVEVVEGRTTMVDFYAWPWIFAKGSLRTRGSVSQGTTAMATQVDASANWAIGLTLLSAPVCCAPLTLLGGFLAVRAIRLARRRGEPAPAKAIVACVVAVLSLAVVAWIVNVGVASQRERNDHIQGIRARLVGKRAAATLDQHAACDLVEEQLLAGLYGGQTSITDLKCGGPYETGPDRAVLRDVEFTLISERIRTSACLARTNRWFVLKVTTDEVCPSGPWAASGATSDDEMQAAEESLRREEAVRSDRLAVEAYTAMVLRVRENLSKVRRAEQPCPPQLDASPFLPTSTYDRPRLAAVDLDFLKTLDAGRPNAAAADWSFLTTDLVQRALDPEATMTARADTIRQLIRSGGPYLVVFQTEERRMPFVPPEGLKTYVGGRFNGWMIVVDARTAAPICETRFLFANAGLRLDSHGRPGGAEQVQNDFATQLNQSASETFRRLTNGQFRLGGG